MKAQVIEYRGHTIEHVKPGRWDAYLTGSDRLLGTSYEILWNSPRHSTLTAAKEAIDQRLSYLYRHCRQA